MLSTRSFDLVDRSFDYEKNKFPRLKGSVGADLRDLEQDRAIRTDPGETRRRRTIRLVRSKGQSWGFTLQTYGIRNKRTQEVDIMSYVDYVEMDGPAWVAGMQRGDIILSVNGESVELCTHKEVVRKIQGSGRELRLVTLFEDCCHKVELHVRCRKLKKLLSQKIEELRSLEAEERKISQGIPLSRMDMFRQSTYSSTSSDWDAYSEIVSPSVLDSMPANRFAFRDHCNVSLSNVSTESSTNSANLTPDSSFHKPNSQEDLDNSFLKPKLEEDLDSSFLKPKLEEDLDGSFIKTNNDTELDGRFDNSGIDDNNCNRNFTSKVRKKENTCSKISTVDNDRLSTSILRKLRDNRLSASSLDELDDTRLSVSSRRKLGESRLSASSLEKLKDNRLFSSSFGKLGDRRLFTSSLGTLEVGRLSATSLGKLDDNRSSVSSRRKLGESRLSASSLGKLDDSRLSTSSLGKLDDSRLSVSSLEIKYTLNVHLESESEGEDGDMQIFSGLDEVNDSEDRCVRLDESGFPRSISYENTQCTPISLHNSDNVPMAISHDSDSTNKNKYPLTEEESSQNVVTAMDSVTKVTSSQGVAILSSPEQEAVDHSSLCEDSSGVFNLESGSEDSSESGKISEQEARSTCDCLQVCQEETGGDCVSNISQGKDSIGADCTLDAVQCVECIHDAADTDCRHMGQSLLSCSTDCHQGVEISEETSNDSCMVTTLQSELPTDSHTSHPTVSTSTLDDQTQPADTNKKRLINGVLVNDKNYSTRL